MDDCIKDLITKDSSLSAAFALCTEVLKLFYRAEVACLVATVAKQTEDALS